MIEHKLLKARRQARERRETHLEQMSRGVSEDIYWKLVGACAELKWIHDLLDEALKRDEEKDDEQSSDG